MMNETRERFLRGILERVSPERIVEIHFFPPIRQGQLESGVAVVALESTPHAVGEHAVAAPVDTPVDAPVDTPVDAPVDAPVDTPVDTPVDEPVAPVMAVASRLEVCTAIYRWTRKGPERGKWEFDFKTEGDASLPIVGTVVRGVEQRSGDELGALRMDADELRALMDTPAWQRTTP